MTISRANGLDIYYETAGEGRPLLLIHPLPYDHNAWLYQVARYAAGFRTIAMDLRGMGRSAKPHEPFSLRDMGDDILGILREEGMLDKNGAGDAVVLGCSVGSKIALMLACDHPEVFKATILVGGNSGPQNQFDHRIKAYRAAAADGTLYDYHLGHLRYGVTPGWADSPIGRHLLAGFAERGRSAFDAESIAQIFGALTVSDLTPKLPAYKTPTLIINGEHDSALAAGRLTASRITQAEQRVLPGTGHCCFLEDPAGFDALVLDFLARHGMWPA